MEKPSKRHRLEHPPAPPLIEDAGVPEILCDELVGLYLTGGVLRLTFAKLLADHAQEPAVVTRRVVARLDIPLAATDRMMALLGPFLERMRGQAAAAGSKPRILQ
jgi:hypothetical protein